MFKLAIALSLFMAATLPGTAEAGNFHPSQQNAQVFSNSSGSDAGSDINEFCRNGSGHGGGHHCGGSASSLPGYTQPPCRGPHKGPNGVMIQCE